MAANPDPRWTSRYAIDKSFIPKDRYVSREFFDMEMERLWPHVWQIACRADRVAKPGDYLEYVIGDQSILVVHGTDGRLRAFHNACRHRGTRLASGAGCFEGRRIRCPFHGWTWKLDGAADRVYLAEEFDAVAIDPQRLRLRECQLDTWGGFVFINMDPDAPPLQQAIGPATRWLDPAQLDRMGVLWHKQVILPINWKAALEAFTESYHLPATHPEYASLGTDIRRFAYQIDGQGHSHYALPYSQGSDPEPIVGADERELLHRYISYNIEQIGAMYVERDREAAARALARPRRDGESAIEAYTDELYAYAAKANIPLPQLTPQQAEHLGGNYVFPHFFCLPTAVNALAYRSRPHGMTPDATLWDIWSLTMFPAGEMPDYSTQQVDWRDPAQVGRVLHQDFSNMLEVSAGMNSRSYDGAYLNLRQEMGIWEMHRELDRYLGVE